MAERERKAEKEQGWLSGLFFAPGAPPSSAPQSDATIEEETYGESGPGKRVRIELEPELVESLPVVSLEEVRECDGTKEGGDGRLLVTYEGSNEIRDLN